MNLLQNYALPYLYLTNKLKKQIKASHLAALFKLSLWFGKRKKWK